MKTLVLLTFLLLQGCSWIPGVILSSASYATGMQWVEATSYGYTAVTKAVRLNDGESILRQVANDFHKVEAFITGKEMRHK